MKAKLRWTADWHVGHENCLKFDNRPYDNLDDMHHDIIRQMNRYTPKHGVLFVLGDVGNDKNLVKEVVSQIQGTKVLIRGNHDGKLDSMYNCGFDVVLEKGQITIGQDIITFTHCPKYGVFREDTTGMRKMTGKENWHGEPWHKHRYSIQDFNQFHLHGHTHMRVDRGLITDGRQMDVGFPAWGRPVTQADVMHWIDKVKKEESGKV